MPSFEDLYNHAPCGHHSLDKDGFIVRVNETQLRWLGYSREEFIGRRLTDFLTAEGRKAFVEHFPRLKSEGSLRDIELDLIRKDGTILPVLLSATAVRDLNGDFVMSRSVLFDLTEHKRLEQIQGLLQAAPDATVVAKQDGRIFLVSAQVERLFGYKPEEVLGQTIEMLIPQRFRTGHVEHRKSYFTQPIARPMGSSLDLYAVRKDGTEFPVEVSLSPLETEEETLVSAAIRDITERKGIEEALRESEARFRVALKNSPIVVFNQDLDLRYTWINSPVLAWARQDYLGRTDAEIVGGEEGARLMAIKQAVVQSGVGVRTEVTVHYLGEPHCFDLTVEPLRDAHGTIIGVTCASVDVTEREHLIEELRQALTKVKQLSGLLPICASCKRIRDEGGSWQQLEKYIHSHSEADFTHGVCPECYEKLYGPYDPKR